MDTIDLVILDLIMPEWSGQQVYHELKRINPEVNVLLASGFSIEGEAERLMNEGVRAFVQKPFRKRKLQDTLKQLLDA